MIKLFGGGTLRNDDARVIAGLRARNLIDETDKLSTPGLLLLTLAMRRQQSDLRVRFGLAA